MPYRISKSRWYLKKAARKGLASVAWASGRLAAAGGGARVLTYHHLGDAAFDPFCVSGEDFQAQMRYLADNSLAISLADLERFIAGQKQLPAGAVLVTIDDGFRSVYTGMLPVLRKYAIPAVAYITPSMVGDGQSARRGEYMSWDEVDRLAAAGVVIGSHGLTHRSLGRMGPLEVRHEALHAREVLQSRLGCRVTSLAYPFGTRADFSNTTANILAEVGYTTAFTSQHGAIRPGMDPITLPRIKVEGGEGLWMFRQLCRGAMDGWRLVDQALWRVQHAGR